MEYVGELIDFDESEKRGRDAGRRGCSYLFDLDYAVDDPADCFSLDASEYGNEARFINHSCDPNMENYQVTSAAYAG